MIILKRWIILLFYVAFLAVSMAGEEPTSEGPTSAFGSVSGAHVHLSQENGYAISRDENTRYKLNNSP